VQGGTKIPTGMTRLRFFRSFFLYLGVSEGEPLALLFFTALQRAVPVAGNSPFFDRASVGGLAVGPPDRDKQQNNTGREK
jgi:hypothetical protein